MRVSFALRFLRLLAATLLEEFLIYRRAICGLPSQAVRMDDEARQMIAKLRLEPLPEEGGYFRQTWMGSNGSAILFLMTPEGFSALHTIAQDEVWHFHAGDPVEHLQLDHPNRSAIVTRMGSDITAGDAPQLIVPRGMWQGARLLEPRRGWALIGCVVTPPWDERGFVLGSREALMRDFPAETARIRTLTR